VAYDRTLLVADNRRCEPKKFGGMLSEMRINGWVGANTLLRTWSKSEISKIIPLSILWSWSVDVMDSALA
jgi:hypothetical protein